jgi:Uma2 family endonuclease
MIAAAEDLLQGRWRQREPGCRLPVMGQAAPRPRVSKQDYLTFERAAEERHEYADGEIFAMSGGTWEHSLIASNITRELSTALLERRCTVHGADMRIHIPATL